MYDRLTDEQLAQRFSDASDLSYASALNVITSDDPSLGRKAAIEFLERKDRRRERQAELTRSRERLRLALTS
jgi:hypothetical protein